MPHQPSQSSWWWRTQSHQSQLRILPLWYAVSHLPIMIYPGSSYPLHLIKRILLYWGFYFLQLIPIFQCCPIACSQSPGSLHIHQRTQLHIGSGLGQQWCGGMSILVSIPSWPQRYLKFLMTMLLLHLHYVLILVRLLLPGLLLPSFHYLTWLCI